MNIAFINWYSFNTVMGGLESVALRLATELSRRGHSVCLVAVKNVYETPEGLDRMFLPAPKQIDGEENYRVLTDYLRQHEVEVMVCHNAYRKKLGRLLERIAKATGIRLVFVLHTTPDYFMHKQVSPAWLGSIVRRVRLWKRRKMWRQMYGACDAFVLLAEPYRPLFARITGLSDVEKVWSIPNPNTYPASDYREELKENKVLFVGRLSKEKGIPALIQIWREVAPQCPDWTLTVLGDGPFRSLLESAKLPRCEVLGVQKPRTFYQRAKLLLMMSDYEGWGMSLVEGMQHGVVPVVFNSYAAAPIILDHGRAGVLVAPGEVSRFAHKVVALLRDKKLRQARAAYTARSVERFDMEPVVTRWEQLFRDLLGSRN